MNELRIRALGGLDVEVDDRPLSAPVPAKGRALLAYLAAVGGRADRSRLAGLLWSELPEPSARQNLRLVLTRLRRAVDHVQADRGVVWLDGAWSADAVDVEAFAANESSADPDHVLDLVRGEFLDGFEVSGAEVFGEWLTARRAQLRTASLALLGDVVGRALSGEITSTAGIAAARRMLELEPADEAAHRALIQLFAVAGQPSAALAQYDTCMHVLHEELGERPSEQTAALADDIRDRITAPATSTIPRLPQLPLSFVGRDAELDRLDRLLDDPSCRLVTIVGAGGVGKTRLAVEFARTWADRDGGRQPAAAFVSFVGVDAVDDTRIDDAVVTTLAEGLSIQLDAGRDPFDVLVERIGGRAGLLLVVDNLEHLPGAGRVLSRILGAAPAPRMLATSRRRLGVGAEWVLPLHGLTTPGGDTSAEMASADAVRLFVDRADAVGAGRDLDRDEVAALCRALDGIPLAIELAARRAAAVPVREMATRLDAALDLLAGTADTDPRHGSIRATLDWSYDLLHADTATSFARLSVFPGSFTAAAAERVADVELAHLSELVEHSLLILGSEGRYRMHPLVRRYAAERLDAVTSLSDTLARRQAMWVAAWFEATADDAAPDDLAAPGLDDERLATRWMLEHATNDELADYLRELAETYRRRSWWTELRTAADTALARDEVSAALRADWLMLVVDADGNIGRHTDAAQGSWDALAALGRPLPNSRTQRLRWTVGHAATATAWRVGLLRSETRRELARRRVRCLDRIGLQWYFSEQFDRVQPILVGNFVEGRVAGDPDTLVLADLSAAMHNLLAGRVGRALRQRDRMVARLDDEAVTPGVAAHALQTAAMVSLTLGEWNAVDHYVERSLHACERGDDLRRTADITLGIAAVARYHTGVRQAPSSQRRVLVDRAVRRGDTAMLTWIEVALAEMRLRDGRIDKAATTARRALELAGPEDLRVDRIRALIVLGRAAVAERRWNDAATVLADAADRLGDRPAYTVHTVEAHAGVPELALDLLEAGHADGVDLRTILHQGTYVLRSYAGAVPIAMPRLRLVEGRIAQLEGRDGAALRAFHRAAQAAERLGMPWEAQQAARRRAAIDRG